MPSTVSLSNLEKRFLAVKACSSLSAGVTTEVATSLSESPCPSIPAGSRSVSRSHGILSAGRHETQCVTLRPEACGFNSKGWPLVQGGPEGSDHPVIHSDSLIGYLILLFHNQSRLDNNVLYDVIIRNVLLWIDMKLSRCIYSYIVKNPFSVLTWNFGNSSALLESMSRT